MLLNIIKINDKRLRTKSYNLKYYNKIKKFFFIKRMILSMYNNAGVGLSSIQVNNNYKIIIINVNKKNKPLIIINPIIIKNNNLYTLCTEGCLSIKNFYLSIPRAEKIIIKYINIYNKIKKKIFSGISSRCIQHEVDHLNCVLILDYNNKIILYE